MSRMKAMKDEERILSVAMMSARKNYYYMQCHSEYPRDYDEIDFYFYEACRNLEMAKMLCNNFSEILGPNILPMLGFIRDCYREVLKSYVKVLNFSEFRMSKAKPWILYFNGVIKDEFKEEPNAAAF